MPVEIGSSLRGAYNWTFSYPVLNNIFSNPFWTSILIVFTIFLLIIILYPCKTNTPMSVLFKLMFYVFITTFGILIIHNGILKFIYKKDITDDKTNELINQVMGTDSGIPSESSINITPQFQTETEQFQNNQQ